MTMMANANRVGKPLLSTAMMIASLLLISLPLIAAVNTNSNSNAAWNNRERAHNNPGASGIALTDDNHPSHNGRRYGKLGKKSDPHAWKADCSKNVDIQLFDDSPMISFKPDKGACKKGKGFVGTAAHFRHLHLNLVPSRANNGKYAASMTNDETGLVMSIGANANGEMVVEGKFQEDYPPEADPEIDDLGDFLDEVASPDDDPIIESVTDGGPFIDSVGGRALVGGVENGGLRGSTGSRSNGNAAAGSRSLATITQLDVLVVWTKYSECRKSGEARGCTLTATTEANMINLIDLAIEETNTAYELSGVNARLNLVHAYRDPTYTEESTNGFSLALSQVRSTSDGIMDDVHSKRTQYGADIVAMIIDDPQYCGLAYLGPSKASMFSVTAWNCATGYYSFGHEIGHNMGCNHDQGTTNSCSSSNHNYGYRDPDAGFRSILAYNCKTGQCDSIASGGCTRVQRFSNINHLYNNKAIGTATADNARKINEVKDTIAGYYDSVTTTPPPTISPQPTQKPTTAMPTTNQPTGNPTQFTCGTITNKNTCDGNPLCKWTGNGANGTCEEDTTPNPTTLMPTSPPPTNFPSKSPSKAPTDSPVDPLNNSVNSSTPTNFPSKSPSKAPTFHPTSASPTMQPSAKPVTDSPATQPTLKPDTDSPTVNPSSSPSHSPSKQPTLKPVTSSPTEQPTAKLVTDSPTNEPTAKPVTESPTMQPSKAPTFPTSPPSVRPTNFPSKSPTNKPTPSPVQFVCGSINKKNDCRLASACTWNGNGNNGECVENLNDGAASPGTGRMKKDTDSTAIQSVTTPDTCTPTGSACDDNCCNGCYTNGRWKDTCK